MTIEGAIVQLQELIDNDDVPFWAKPSLQKVLETVEEEREKHINDCKTGKWINDKKSVCGGAFLERECHCSECGLRRDFIGWKFDNYCSYCGAKMEGYE